jgi:hypothetical protein
VDGPVLILADNYRLARDYARDHDLGREGHGWRYVHDGQGIRGRSGPGRYVIVTIGAATWRQLDERSAMIRYLDSHGFELVDG